MAEQIAQFRFLTHQITKSLIEISDAASIDQMMDVEIQKADGVDEEENKYKVEINIKIEDKNKSLNIEITAVGFFEFDSGIEESKKSIFFNVNAPAILFPYIRAYISALTSLSGIKTITIPTINLSGRAEK